MNILPLGCLGLQEIAQCSTVLWRWFLPVFLDGIPAVTQALFISVAIRRDDGSDPFGMRKREPKSHWCTVIEDVDCKAIQANCLRKISHYFGQVLKGVPKTLPVGGIGEAKTREVSRDNVVAIAEGRNQVAKHMRRGREAVKQENRWFASRPRSAIETIVAVSDGTFVPDHLR